MEEIKYRIEYNNKHLQNKWFEEHKKINATDRVYYKTESEASKAADNLCAALIEYDQVTKIRVIQETIKTETKILFLVTSPKPN